MKNFIWSIFKKLGNLNFSIFILLLIASISILGTIIPQDQNLSYYQFNYPVHHSLLNLNWQIIIHCRIFVNVMIQVSIIINIIITT